MSGTISDDEVAAMRAAGYTDTQLADIALAVALTVFTNTFNHCAGLPARQRDQLRAGGR